MGKLLQIRVLAQTVDEGAVAKKWPGLWDVVWGEGGAEVPRKGVMELAKAVFDGAKFCLYPQKQCDALLPMAEKADALRQSLEKALGARSPQEADRISYDLEECLSELEDIAQDF